MSVELRSAFRKTASEVGATMVEYALLLGLIAATTVGVVTSLGASTSDQFETVAAQMESQSTTDTTTAPEDDSSGGSGGSGGSGSVTTTTLPTTTTTAPPATTTTTTTLPPTTTTTVPPTTTTTIAPTTTTTTLPPQEHGVSAAENTSKTKWNKNEDKWSTEVDFENTWDEEADIQVEITYHYADGSTSTETKKLGIDEDDTESLKLKNMKYGPKDDTDEQVVAATFTVVEVTTKDSKGNKVTFATNDPQVTVKAPPR